MPTVPVYGGPRVATAPLPGARLSPDAPAAAFTPAPGPDLSGVTRVVAEIAQQEKQKADQVAVLDADNQLGQLQDTILYDPQRGVLNARGKNALDASSGVADQWQTGVSKIAAGLKNDDQRMAFQRMAMLRGLDLHQTVERHVSSELRAYDDDTTKAAIGNAINDGLTNFGDPARVDQAVQKAQAILKDYAKRNGLSADVLQGQLADTTSRIHAGVIDRMLAVGQDQAARSYYDAHKAALTGADADSVDKALEEGTTRGESQRQADTIMGKATSRAAALDMVREISDPKIRDLTEDRVNRAWSERTQAEQEQREQTYLTATNLIDQHPGRLPRDVIPPSQWATLTLEQRNALERRAEEPTSNDDKAWLSFMALDEQAIGQMPRSTFEAKYWSRFDAQHRSRADALWHNARDAAQNPKRENPELASTLTYNERVFTALSNAGVIPPNKTTLSQLSKDQAATARAFDTEAARRVEEYQLTELGGKRKATGDEIQRIVDRMAITVFVNKPHARDPQQVAGLAHLTDDEKGNAYVPIGKIPDAERNRIEALIQQAGGPVTDDKVQRAYAAYALDDFDLFNRVISEGAVKPAATPAAAPMPNLLGLP